jgi:hypothetical protein
VIQILGYDSSAVYHLTLPQIPAWLQQTGSWLWLHGTAVNESDLEEIGCLFNLHRDQWAQARLRGQASCVEALHRYVFIRLPFPAEEQDGFFQLFLGRNFLLSFSSELPTAVDAIRARYETEARLWAHGPDHLMQLLVGAAVDLTTGAVEKLENGDFGHGPLPPAVPLFETQQHLMALRYRVADQFDAVNELGQLEHDLIDANVRYQLRHSGRRLAGLRRRLEERQESLEGRMQAATYLELAQTRGKVERLALLLPLLLALLIFLLLAIFLALVLI